MLNTPASTATPAYQQAATGLDWNSFPNVEEQDHMTLFARASDASAAVRRLLRDRQRVLLAPRTHAAGTHHDAAAAGHLLKSSLSSSDLVEYLGYIQNQYLQRHRTGSDSQLVLVVASIRCPDPSHEQASLRVPTHFIPVKLHTQDGRLSHNGQASFEISARSAQLCELPNLRAWFAQAYGLQWDNSLSEEHFGEVIQSLRLACNTRPYWAVDARPVLMWMDHTGWREEVEPALLTGSSVQQQKLMSRLAPPRIHPLTDIENRLGVVHEDDFSISSDKLIRNVQRYRQRAGHIYKLTTHLTFWSKDQMRRLNLRHNVRSFKQLVGYKQTLLAQFPGVRACAWLPRPEAVAHPAAIAQRMRIYAAAFEAAQRRVNHLQELVQTYQSQVSEPAELHYFEARQVAAELEKLSPWLQEDYYPELISTLYRLNDHELKHVGQRLSVLQVQCELLGVLKMRQQAQMRGVDLTPSWAPALHQLEHLGQQELPLSQTVNTLQAIEDQYIRTQAALNRVWALQSCLPQLDLNLPSALARAAAFCELASQAPLSSLAYRTDGLGRSIAPTVIATAEKEFITIRHLKKSLEEHLTLSGTLDIQILDKAVATLATHSGWVKQLTPAFSQAKKLYESLSKGGDFEQAKAHRLLGMLAQYHRLCLQYEGNALYQQILGPAKKSGRFKDIAQIMRWNQLIDLVCSQQGIEGADTIKQSPEDTIVQWANLGHAISDLSTCLDTLDGYLRQQHVTLQDINWRNSHQLGRHLQSLHQLIHGWREAVDLLRKEGVDFEKSPQHLITHMDIHYAVKTTEASLHEFEDVISLLGQRFFAEDTNFEPLHATLGLVKTLQSLKITREFKSALLLGSLNNNVAFISGLLNALRDDLNLLDECVAWMQSMGECSISSLTGNTRFSSRLFIRLAQQLTVWSNNPDLISQLSTLTTVQAQLEKQGLDILSKSLLEPDTLPSQVVFAYLALLSRSILMKRICATQHLASLSGDGQALSYLHELTQSMA